MGKKKGISYHKRGCRWVGGDCVDNDCLLEEEESKVRRTWIIKVPPSTLVQLRLNKEVMMKMAKAMKAQISMEIFWWSSSV